MLLKDTILQDELKRNGYVIIPFLDPNEVKRLNTFYDQIHAEQDPPNFIDNIHMTTWCSDAAYKQKVSENLREIFKEASERFFKNYRRLNHVFIVKKNGSKTTFKVHQDWNVVDETKYESVNVWVPLHDVDEKSGALWVLKGSHHINRKIRGASYLFPEYGHFNTELEQKAISVTLKAGEAIVFYHSVIHGSPPNLSEHYRKAACFTVIPKEAPLCIYFQPSADAPLEQHEPEDEFMFNYNQLRIEAAIKSPSPKPVNQMPPFENKRVEFKELQPFIKPKNKWFSFWWK